MADTKINSVGERQPVDDKSRYAEMSASELSKELAQEVGTSKSNFINLNLFAANYSNKTDSQLNKSRKSNEQRIAEHKQKMNSPQDFVKEWNEYSDVQKNGLKEYWAKEIRNYEQQIKLIDKEFEKRKQY